MNPYIEQVNAHLAEKVGNDGDSVLELLCHYYYTLENWVDSEGIQCRFKKLDQILKRLTASENTQVSDLVYELCTEHVKEGFMEGIRVGFCLDRELTAPEG